MIIEVNVTEAADTFSERVWLDGDGNRTGKQCRVELSCPVGTGCIKKLKRDGITERWRIEFDGVKTLEIPVAGWYSVGMLAAGFVSPTTVSLEA